VKLAGGALAAALAVAAAGLASAKEATREACYLTEDEDGQVSVSAFPELDLIHSDDAALPALPPGRILGVDCSRNSLVPSLGDYRVILQYGLPLTITSSKRVAVLEVAGGRVRYRNLTDRFSAEEITLIKARMDALQPKMSRRAP
jgi:hypothetical protein